MTPQLKMIKLVNRLMLRSLTPGKQNYYPGYYPW